MNFNNLLERLRITVGEKGRCCVRRGTGQPSRHWHVGSPALITLNPGVGIGVCSPWRRTPGPGFWLIFPCDEERAGAVPAVLAACCARSRHSPATWARLLLQTLLAAAHFLGGFVERVRPIKVVVGAWAFPWGPHGTLHGDPGLPGEEQAKVSPRPRQHLVNKKPVTWGTNC